MNKKFLIAAALFLLQGFASAQEFPLSAVPDPLKAWVPWVLDQQENRQCPHSFDNGDTRSCQWPAVLDLKVTAKGAEFTQMWQVFGDTWISLPGDKQHWPQEVLVDGKALPVISRAGVPSLRLKPGSYKITGRFFWNQVPESLGMALNSGLVRLEMDGKLVAHPVRDESNRIWLQKKQEVSSVEQTQLKVFRKVSDGIPVLVETRFHLEVSGKVRELNLGRALLPGLIPQALNSNLTASLNQEGNLLVQARPGTWDISLVSRLPADIKSLTLPAGSGLLADEEVWVYAANPSVRLASVEGPTSIDVQQTTVPDEWRNLPAFLMRPVSSQFSLKQIRRGDSEPTPDKLKLQRHLWLSFDGKDMTVSDQLSGSMSRPAQLNMVASAQPGRIAVNGEDQQISSGSDKLAGVEVQGGNLMLKADSRLPQAPRGMNATLWTHDVDALGMDLHLPPGWRLLHASGVDQAKGSWISSWNLLDFFLVLITALVAGHLWGKQWGTFALFTLVSSYQEIDAPRGVWIACFALIALYRVLPDGKLKLGVQWLQRGSVLGLILLSLAFATTQIRSAMYPVLENEGIFDHIQHAPIKIEAPVEAVIAEAPPAPPADSPPSPPGEPIEMNSAPPYIPPPEALVKATSNKLRAKIEDREDGYVSSLARNSGVDPEAKVQTGPGLPNWNWRSHELRFDGPVTQHQEIYLWLQPPWVSKLLVVLRLIFLALMLLCVIKALIGRNEHHDGENDDGNIQSNGHMNLFMLWSQLRSYLRKVGATSTTSLNSGVMILLLFMIAASGLSLDAYAQMPSEEHLQALREKLTRKAECLPECAEISRLTVHVSGSMVRLTLDVDAAIDTSLPLPGGKKTWLPHEARLDGKNAFVDRDGAGNLSFLAPAGRHRLELVGELLQNDTLQLPLPRQPRRVDIDAPGWDVAGISEETGAADTIQLSRQVKLGKDAKKNADADFPALLRIHRTIYFMKEWWLETVIERMSPKGTPVLAQVSLLPGEAVNTAGINVQDDRVLVNMGPQSDRMSWTSSLKQAPSMQLKAMDHCAEPKLAQCLEQWTLLANNIWHLEHKGIPPMVGSAGSAQSFLPWPGESLELQIERPQAVAGQTLTIDQSRLQVTPGARSSDYQLFLVLRSSRGMDHSLNLPKGAVLQKVMINGAEFPIRAVGQKLTLPVTPGRQEITLSWRMEQGLGPLFSSESVTLGGTSVNSTVEVSMPEDRWLLALSGEGMGPAILFWSKLFVLMLVACGLAQLKMLPVSRLQWVLLALGMTQLSWLMIALTLAWFFAFASRASLDVANKTKWQVNARQILLCVHTVVFLLIILDIIRGGLLGHPDMQIVGNESYGNQLHWYQDRIDGAVQSVTVFSLPMMVYRGMMLLWALWLASSLIAWMKWAWLAFSAGGIWKKAGVTNNEMQVSPVSPQSKAAAADSLELNSQVRAEVNAEEASTVVLPDASNSNPD